MAIHDGKHFVRSFSQKARAEFTDGTAIGDVFVMLVRGFTVVDESTGEFENLEWWGYLEVEDSPSVEMQNRLARDPIVLRGAANHPLPIDDLELETVLDAHRRYLVVEAG